MDSGWRPHRALGCWAGESCCGKAGGEDLYPSAACGNQEDKDQLAVSARDFTTTNAMGTVHMAATSLKTDQSEVRGRMRHSR